jgi:hypothetical protein
MRRHGGASHASAKSQHFLLGAALAALLLGLEESGEATHRSAHVSMHPVRYTSGAARRCHVQKPDVSGTSPCPKKKAASGVRPKSN